MSIGLQEKIKIKKHNDTGRLSVRLQYFIVWNITADITRFYDVKYRNAYKIS